MTSEIRANKQTNRAGLGTVTYADTGIIVSGIVTCTELSGLTALNIAGVGTASTLDINGDIDVDGHTNLDNVNIAGVTTITANNVIGLNVENSSGSGAQTTIRSKSTVANASNFVRSESSDNKYIGLLKYGTGHSAYGALASGGGAVYANSSVPITIMSDGGYINFATGGNTERLRIHSTGQISANVNNNSYELTIGGLSGGPTLLLRDSGTTGSPRILFGNTSAALIGGITYNNSSNYMEFATNGTEKLRITSAGDVGIGYNSPTVKLHVREAASGASSYDNRHHIIVEDDSEAYVGFYVPDSGYAGIRFYDTTGQEGFIDYYYSDDSMNFSSTATHIFKTAGSEKLRITSGGQLELRKDQNGVTGRPDNRIVFKDTDTSVAGNQPIGEISWHSSDAGMTNINAYIRGINEHTNGNGALLFGVKQAGSSEIEAMRISSLGRVGIGTVNPEEVLHVLQSGTTPAEFKLGNSEGYLLVRSDNNLATYDAQQHLFRSRDGSSEYIRITSDGLMGLGVSPTSHNNTTAFHIHDDYNSQGYPRIRLTNQSSGTTSSDGYEIILNGDSKHAVHRQRENADIYFMTNNLERLRITASGQLHIKNGNSIKMSLYNDPGPNVNHITSNNGNEIKVSSGNGDSNGIEFWDYTGTNKRCQIDGHGIKFNTDTAEANALDDYEEGLWQPQVLDGNGSNYTINYTNANCRYIKIGRMVFCYYVITRTESGSKTGNLRIYGTTLPFALDETFHGGSYWVDHGGPTTGQGDIIGGVHYGTSNGVYWVFPNRELGTTSTAPNRYLQHGQWTNGRPIYGMFHYTTAA